MNVVNNNNGKMFDFRSQITKKILGYYFLNPAKKNYINELAEILAVDRSNLFRKLKELEKEGLLKSEFAGNQNYFYLNKSYPLLKEIKKTYEAKYGLVLLLKEKLKRLPGLKEAYIFGSFAKDSLQQDSDIDILLIGSHSSIAAKRLILPLQKTLKREINIIDLTVAEFTKKKRVDDFIKRIFTGKVIQLH